MRIRAKYLPKIYQELEYVEANRQVGQHVIVDYAPTSADSIELDFVLTDRTVTSTLWCARYGYNDRTMTAFWIASSSIRCDYNASQTNIGSINVGDRHILSYAKGVWKLDGTTKSSQAYSNFTSQAISLFASYANSPASVSDNQSYIKLYHFRVTSEDGTKQVDLIPCRRLTDNKVGLYNAVTGTFLTPASKDLRAGPARNTHTFMPRLPSLPQEYQQVEYIRNSNGAQYIDTGWIPNYNTGFEVKIVYSPSVLAKRYCLMANYNQGDAQLSLELRVNNKARFWIYNGTTDTDSGTTITTGVNISVFKYENTHWTFTTNGVTTTGTRAATPLNSTKSMWMFLDRAKRTSTFPSPLSIYSCEIWQGSVLVRNFIPCRRKSDNAYGMYDMVTKAFFGNLGTGAFTGGSDVISLLNMHLRLQRLPSAYQEVEYIESTGTQYIDTAIKPTTTLMVEIDYAIKQMTAANNIAIFGVVSGNYGLFSGIAGHNYYINYTLGALTDIPFSFNIRYREKYVGNTLVRGSTTYTTNAITAVNNNTYLFARNRNDSAERIGTMDIYGCKLYDNSGIVRNFVPCYRKSDNVIGMYDLVGNQFYTNQGTGTFLKGNNINII